MATTDFHFSNLKKKKYPNVDGFDYNILVKFLKCFVCISFEEAICCVPSRGTKATITRGIKRNGSGDCSQAKHTVIDHYMEM